MLPNMEQAIYDYAALVFRCSKLPSQRRAAAAVLRAAERPSDRLALMAALVSVLLEDDPAILDRASRIARSLYGRSAARTRRGRRVNRRPAGARLRLVWTK
jgi:hypothetical protein